MKPEFGQAYLNLFYEYPRQEFEYISPRYYRDDRLGLIRTIRNRIIELNDSASPNRRMRSDAMYFLLVNIHHMIVKPVIEVDRSGGGEYAGKFELDILDDLSTIVRTAFEESGDRQISGHAILNVVNNIWKDLKTTKIEIWGDDERLD